MKLFVKNGYVITVADDTAGVTVDGCEVYFVPYNSVKWPDDGPLLFSSLGITRADSDRFEAQMKLQQSDAAMARVMEDIISLWVSKGLMTVDELPEAAREKIANRQAWREVVG